MHPLGTRPGRAAAAQQLPGERLFTWLLGRPHLEPPPSSGFPRTRQQHTWVSPQDWSHEVHKKAEGTVLPRKGRYNHSLQLHRAGLRLTAQEQEPVVTVQKEILMLYKKNICMVRKVKYWNRLPREAVLSAPMEILKTWLDGLMWLTWARHWARVGLDNVQWSLPTSVAVWFYVYCFGGEWGKKGKLKVVVDAKGILY